MSHEALRSRDFEDLVQVAWRSSGSRQFLLHGARRRSPDLAVFGKAIASGYPISALAGRKQWMQPIADGKVIHAGTMNSANACVAAALATIEVLEREKVHAQLFTLRRRLMQGFGMAASSLNARHLPRYFGVRRGVTLYNHTTDQGNQPGSMW